MRSSIPAVFISEEPSNLIKVPHIDTLLQAEALHIARTMTDIELAGQALMMGIDACGSVSSGEQERLMRLKPGAIMLFRKNLDAPEQEIRMMNDTLMKSSAVNVTLPDASTMSLPPFIACDHEGGSVHRFRKGVASLPPAGFYGELAGREGVTKARETLLHDSELAARELSRLGITMNLAPVAEILTPDNKAFLKDRSYGSDAAWTTQAALDFMQGMESAGIACIIKHFPGNTNVDPHKSLPFIRLSDKALKDAVAPFYKMAETGIPAGIMIAHSIAAAWDPQRSASLSSIVIQEKLIGEGDLYGIILADDFSMGAVGGNLDTLRKTISALAAGVDMVMAWPANAHDIHKAILKALAAGTLSRDRLINAAEHIIYQKLRFRQLRQKSYGAIKW
ncbi:MAG: glycoside hydrolase family 3 protein [Spirochaetaceae bacterium]|nr:glycoside hydrolase family 3 protein [Spirochaetaceae bacterium]